MTAPSALHDLNGATTLVTGATGFLGRYLCEVLIQRGARLRLLIRDASRLDVLASARPGAVWETCEGSVLDADAVVRAAEGADFVVHAAAAVGFGGAKALAQMRRVNVEGTATVAEAARLAGARRLLHVSSIAALGRPERPSGPLDESATWQTSRMNTTYATTKYEAELEIHRAIAEGLDATFANPALIFGVGRRGENTMQIVERAARGRMPLVPSGGTTVVDVRDVAEGCARVLERGETGERYILAGDDLGWRDIIATLAEAYGANPPRATMPPRLAATLGTLAELGAKVLGKEAAFTREAARLSSRTQHYSSQRAQRDLGMNFRPFGETARWLAEEVHFG